MPHPEWMRQIQRNQESITGTVFLTTIGAAAQDRAPGRAIVRAAAGDGRNDEYLVAIFKRILLVAQEADIFLVDVEVDEAAHLSGLIAQVCLKRGKMCF